MIRGKRIRRLILSTFLSFVVATTSISTAVPMNAFATSVDSSNNDENTSDTSDTSDETSDNGEDITKLGSDEISKLGVEEVEALLRRGIEKELVDASAEEQEIANQYGEELYFLGVGIQEGTITQDAYEQGIKSLAEEFVVHRLGDSRCNKHKNVGHQAGAHFGTEFETSGITFKSRAGTYITQGTGNVKLYVKGKKMSVLGANLAHVKYSANSDSVSASKGAANLKADNHNSIGAAKASKDFVYVPGGIIVNGNRYDARWYFWEKYYTHAAIDTNPASYTEVAFSISASGTELKVGTGGSSTACPCKGKPCELSAANNTPDNAGYLCFALEV